MVHHTVTDFKMRGKTHGRRVARAVLAQEYHVLDRHEIERLCGDVGIATAIRATISTK